MNDLRVQRGRHEDLAADLDLDRSGGAELGSPAGLGTTTAATAYPTTAAVFYAIQPCDIQGTEKEGQAATYIARTGPPIFALNLGTAIPPQGTPVVYHAVGGRYAFRYDG